MKKLIKFIYVFIAKMLGAIFFKRKYMISRHFLYNNIEGAKWIYRSIIFQKILGINRSVPFPISHNVRISNYKNIEFDVDDLNNFQGFGCYFQNFDAMIKIGKGTYIAPNVGLITSNHDPLSLSTHLSGQGIIIGENCWLGMNSVILPGVQLGNGVIVGAGSVVNRSFTENNILIAGVPAVIKKRYNNIQIRREE